MSHTIAHYEDLTVSLPVEVSSLGGDAQEAAEAAAFEAECQRVHGIPFTEFEATCDMARAIIVAERKQKTPNETTIAEALKVIAAACALKAPEPVAPAEKE